MEDIFTRLFPLAGYIGQRLLQFIEDLVLRDLYRCSGNFLPVHSSEHHPQYLRRHSSYEKFSVDCSSLLNNHSDATCSRIHERKAPDIRKEFANTSIVVETNYNYVDSPVIFQGLMLPLYGLHFAQKLTSCSWRYCFSYIRCVLAQIRSILSRLRKTLRGSVDDIGWLQRSPGLPSPQDGTDRFLELLAEVRNGEHKLSNSYVYLLIPGLFSNHGPLYFVAIKKFFSKMGLDCHIAKIHSEASVEHNALVLRQYIEELYWGSGKLVMLLGHSKGGIDAAAALSLYWTNLRDKVAGLALVQSPYGGTPIASDILREGQIVDKETHKFMELVVCKLIKLGRRMESIVLPIELLQQFKSLDFPNQQEYEAWQRRHFKVLEAGLLLYPYLPLDKKDTAAKRLQQIIQGGLEKPVEVVKNMEIMQAFRSLVMSLSFRSFDGTASETCHWADGFPLNLKLYQLLLESCFDVNEETYVVEEVDEVLELIKKTWTILGINQMLHNLCFAWVLFCRFVTIGQIENDLLFASNNLLVEVEKDANAIADPVYTKVLCSVASSMLDWAEKRLCSYRDIFHSDNIEIMQSVVSLAVLSAKIMAGNSSHGNQRKRKDEDVSQERVETYIRSSLRTTFSQKWQNVSSNKRLSNNQNNRLPVLSILAQDLSELAFSEKAIFSPVLKNWHPLAAGVAVATLHSCYGKELKQFLPNITELTPDTILVLRAADKLEKDLVQIAVEESVNSEDGGKSIIREMPPYEAEAVIISLVKSWIKTRVDRLKEWVDRNLQQEVWNPRVNKEHFAPSAVEALRIIDETLEAFFMLPVPMHSILLPELIVSLDICLQHYIKKTKSGCGSRSDFMPTLPSLTRCSTGSRFHGAFKKKDKNQIAQRRKSQGGTTNGDNSFGIPQLCVRINTLQLIRLEMGVFEKRIIAHLGNLEPNQANGKAKMFELSAIACVEGIQQLCEATSYKIIFHEVNHVLWDGLYMGDVPSSRIEPCLQELEQYLEIISSTVHDRARTRIITDVMKAAFDGFLLVLLAGGPSRSFTQQDCVIIEEDFKYLKDLFWSNGDGLPFDLIEKCSPTVKNVLPLFHTDTENLIEQFKRTTVGNNGASTKSLLPLPPTTGNWNQNEPNTLLRVLCYRNDEAAAKFLKKTFNLPKKL